MLKNKLKALFIMLIILLLAFSPFVFAEDEDTIMPKAISEENGVTVEESTEETNSWGSPPGFSFKSKRR